MIENIIIALAKALLSGGFRKSYALWGMKWHDTKWTKICEGPMPFLKLYVPKLFGEGWRTDIIGTGIDRNMLPTT